MPQTPMPQVHPIPLLFDAESRVLILGSFPSIKSREAMFSMAIRRTASGRCSPC